MTPTPHDKPIPSPRPVRYRELHDGMDAQGCHEIRIALAIFQEDEDRARGRTPRDQRRIRGDRPGNPEVDTLIRAACYDACNMHDMRTVERIHDAIHGIAASKGKKAPSVGPVIACEIMDAISRLWDEYDADADCQDDVRLPSR